MIDVARGDVRIAVDVQGEGTPVVLLHGFPDDHGLWRNVAPGLNRAGMRTIAPDLRGFGASTLLDDPADHALTEHVADVTAILDQLEIERAHIVGHDWGAVVAWMTATLAPDRVDRLAVFSVGNIARLDLDLLDLRRYWYMFLFQFDEVEEYLGRDDWAALRMWLTFTPDAERSLALLQRPGALRSAINIYRGIANPANLLAPALDLPPIAADTMGVWSTRDGASTEEQMIASGRFVTGSWRYERLDGPGHWIPLEVPERATELLLDFLG